MEYIHGLLDGVILVVHLFGKVIDESEDLDDFRRNMDMEVRLLHQKLIRRRGEELEEEIIQEP
jgi:hypothetical protein